MTEDLSIEYQFIKDVVALNLKVLDTETEGFMDNLRVRVTMKDTPENGDDPDDTNVIDSCAFGLRKRCRLH